MFNHDRFRWDYTTFYNKYILLLLTAICMYRTTTYTTYILLAAVLCPVCLAWFIILWRETHKPVFPPRLVSGPPNNANVTKFSLDKIGNILNKPSTLNHQIFSVEHCLRISHLNFRCQEPSTQSCPD